MAEPAPESVAPSASPEFTSPSSSTDLCPILSLPAELMNLILRDLSPFDLASVSETCYGLRKHAISDTIWRPFVQENVPGVTLTEPGPCASFKDLYTTHDPNWFLPRYKIWFCDRDRTGKFIVVRFDPRRGCIEGYEVVAAKGVNVSENWTDPGGQVVQVSLFEPRVSLHLDIPVLNFRIRQPGDDEEIVADRFAKRPGADRFADEIPMQLDDRRQSMFSNFFLTRRMDPDIARQRLAKGYPYHGVWPPANIPSQHHVHRHSHIRPHSRAEASDHSFAIRRWMQMPGTPRADGITLSPEGTLPRLIAAISVDNYASRGLPGVPIHIGEEVMTFSTIDPALYTPTPLKPWRGIWVGDYNDHGCEFILVHQPDDETPATDEQLGIVRGKYETDEEWEERRTKERTYRGRLEAVKLTGDPNIPRGEQSFYVEDLGGPGSVDSREPPFEGVRMVKSKGHLSESGFVRDIYVDGRLLLVDHNRLAHYWSIIGYVNYYVRVDIDSLLHP